ncbi:ABC transporter ATP-binding protein [Leucobacter chromiireducens]|uniref:ABC transporter ATP-binding protein n=1 Tax=Leucobacter chromiireducens subsp. solipictus TaxID=398235 RepID=A0ABS1SD08_9MICO|nr:ABC transporter ATP-binding protein [Leucobacter chromiireducens]MBL3678430.1 ABC transporter ATP-binding protein [Leucobacter chromiireducens subsp. solipictus]
MQTGAVIPIDVRGLRKSYGGREVLRGVDLAVAPGETYALLGPNGAGKSTAIEILEGVRRPDHGEVRVLGVDPLTAPRAWRANVGVVAQGTGDFGPYTVRELVTHFAALYAHPRTAAEVLELVGLREQAGTRAAKLSGGQQRRLDVALGIVGRPSLLFLDEPTTGFDPAARRQFWDMLETLTGEGTAILLTTHYLDEAARLADRVGVLSGGTIVAEAPPAELGGPDARMPVVTWRDPDGSPREERTDAPTALVARLRDAALAAGDPTGEPAELEVRRPGLEDVYLALIHQHSAGEAAPGDAGSDERSAPELKEDAR